MHLNSGLSRHRDLFAYWNTVRGNRPMPTRADIDPIDIVPILPFVGIVERRESGYFWRLVGTAIVENFGRDPTGLRYGEGFSPASFIAETVATFDAALDQKTAFFDECVYGASYGAQHAVSRLVCPLGPDGSHVPMVIHSRIQRYVSPIARLSPSLPNQPWGQLRHRRPVASIDEVDRQTARWHRDNCAIGV
jgi:hypothetical protein